VKKVFSPGSGRPSLLKHFLETALQAEMDNHLATSKTDQAPNRRNGKTTKRVRAAAGEFDLETPRDRVGSFEPQAVAKRQVILTEQLEGQIISMYGRGMSYSGISEHVEEMYGYTLSGAQISSITDKIIPLLKEWQSRPLSSIYAVVWLDAMYYKVRHEGKVVTRVLYSVIGLNLAGRKEVLGIYLTDSEGAKFWLGVLTDFKQRGVEDIFIACVDGLKGFPQAIEAAFPQTLVQLCVVHQIRQSLRFIPDKHAKAFMTDLKAVYQADDRSMAEESLLVLEQNWGKTYPNAVRGWVDNWERLAVYFDFPAEIRKIIYTTNTIEAYHRQIRKLTKTKAAFASDMALLKLAFLAIRHMEESWRKTTYNWKQILSQLVINFGERIPRNAFS
jgi:putative transposase